MLEESEQRFEKFTNVHFAVLYYLRIFACILLNVSNMTYF